MHASVHTCVHMYIQADKQMDVHTHVVTLFLYIYVTISGVLYIWDNHTAYYGIMPEHAS